jgi:polyphosphate kinase
MDGLATCRAVPYGPVATASMRTSRLAPDTRIEVRPVLRQVRSHETEEFLDHCFQAEILPLLTPVALDRGHPLPTLRGGALGLAVRFRAADPRRYGVVLVHPALPARIEAPGGEIIPLEHVIAAHVPALFGRLSIESCWVFRVVEHDSQMGDARDEVSEFLAIALRKTHRRREESFQSVG